MLPIDLHTLGAGLAALIGASGLGTGLHQHRARRRAGAAHQGQIEAQAAKVRDLETRLVELDQRAQAAEARAVHVEQELAQARLAAAAEHDQQAQVHAEHLVTLAGQHEAELDRRAREKVADLYKAAHAEVEAFERTNGPLEHHLRLRKVHQHIERAFHHHAEGKR